VIDKVEQNGLTSINWITKKMNVLEFKVFISSHSIAYLFFLTKIGGKCGGIT